MNAAVHDGVFWAAMAVIIPVCYGLLRWLIRMANTMNRLETKVDDLAAEFPKNGVPTRSVIDEIKISAVELKTSYESHLKMMHGQRPR